MIKLFSADICPYAQRVRALLVRLGQPFETCIIDLSNRDPEFLDRTPTGKVPLLIDDDLKLYESQVINDYLSERNEWKEAYDAQPQIRSRQKLAMKQWDSVVIPAWYRGLQAPSSFEGRIRDRVKGELAELAATVGLFRDKADNLPGYHFAPFWARVAWTRDNSPLATMIEEYEGLRTWLDRAVELPAVQQTLPDRETAMKRNSGQFSSSGY
jgi:glutathione S-transferase